jgi:hypothetical protein
MMKSDSETDERWRSSLGKVTLALVLIMAFYTLSVGPAVWLAHRGFVAGRVWPPNYWFRFRDYLTVLPEYELAIDWTEAEFEAEPDLTPDQTDLTPDQTVLTPNQTDLAPDQPKLTRDQTLALWNQVFVLPADPLPDPCWTIYKPLNWLYHSSPEFLQSGFEKYLDWWRD